MKRLILTTVMITFVLLGMPGISNAQVSDSVLWQLSLSHSRIDAFENVFNRNMDDIVVVGLVYHDPNSDVDQILAKGLNATTGDELWTTPLVYQSTGNYISYVHSIQTIKDSTGDGIDEVLISYEVTRTVFDPSDPCYPSCQVLYIVDSVRINPVTGERISYSERFATRKPLSQNNFLNPLIGDYDGDGVRNEYLLLKSNNPLQSNATSLQALRQE